MNDLELWQRLANADVSTDGDAAEVDALVVSLAALSELSIAERAPFFGFFERHRKHPAPQVRAAILDVLAGCTGHVGVVYIVDALDDAEHGVRAAAVRALRATATAEPARWAHAIFHPREDVRRAALEHPQPPSGADTLGVYLRSDPLLRPLAERYPWPPKSCVLVFDLYLRGDVDKEQAGQALETTPVQELRALLRSSIRRDDAEVLGALQRLTNGSAPTPSGRDVLDLWCAIYWGAPASRVALIERLTSATFGGGHALERRVALALLTYGDTHGHHTDTLQLSMACCPGALASTHISIEDRRRGTPGLARHREAMRAVPADLLKSLLGSELAPSQDSLELATACILASQLRTSGTLALVDIFGEAPLIEAAKLQPDAWPHLIRLRDDVLEGPLWFLDRIRPGSAHAFARIMAAGLPVWAAMADRKQRNGPAKGARASFYVRALSRLDGPSTAAALVQLALTSQGLPIKHLERLVSDLDAKMRPAHLSDVFSQLIPHADNDTVLAVLQRLGHRRAKKSLVSALSRMDTSLLQELCGRFESLNLSAPKGLALAEALSTHADPAIATWARAEIEASKPRPPHVVDVQRGARALTSAQAARIRDAPADELSQALEPALGAPTQGLCAALESRGDPTEPSLTACVALLGSGDPVPAISAQLDRFGTPDSRFIEALEPRVVAAWQGNPNISLLGHAWLHRWEQHGFAVLAWIDRRKGGLAETLRHSSALREPLGRAVLWEGVMSAVLLRRYRQRARLQAWATAETLSLLVEHLDTDLGPFAARMLSTFHVSGLARDHLVRLRERTMLLMPDMDRATRRELERWIRVDGLVARSSPARTPEAAVAKDKLAVIRASDDVTALAVYCASTSRAVVHEATLRLVELGSPGQSRLVALLGNPPSNTAMLAAAESVTLWTDPTSISRVEEFARHDTTPPQTRFRLALALGERNQAPWLAPALAAACAPTSSTWFTAKDWQRLVERAPDPTSLSIALAVSPHPHAYQHAVRRLLEDENHHGAVQALLAFLRMGTLRPTYLRRLAAGPVLAAGHAEALVVRLGEILDSQGTQALELFEESAPEHHARLADHALWAALLGGSKACAESQSLELLSHPQTPTATREAGLSALLRNGCDAAVRQRLADGLGRSLQRDLKLGAVSEIFAWGVRKGRELTGRLFRVHMTGRRQDLGYTRMTESTIYVSALPVLRGDRNGRDVVEALILHEYGHHLYHRDELSQELWARAHREGIGSVLNLVADEHLERRLRADNQGYGDKLKRLGAYAFQHSDRELPLKNALAMLQGSSFDALTAKPLGTAFGPEAVIIESGVVLRELDRRGHAFARFVRAMRMGLGNRHGDARLEDALALFKGGFRHHDMRGLYEIAVKLSQIYGTQSQVADTFGGHESLEWDDRGSTVHADGLTDDDVQQEVERILRPPSAAGEGAGSGKPGKLSINVGPDTQFTDITQVERIPADASLHRTVATEVRRHAFRLRQYFQEIGLALVPRRGRLQGRAFDRTRILAVVTRRDPRMLVARELEVHTDLFIGVVIDCSGSMAAGRSMEKAHRFGVLLAEAARGLAGVDARFFGFTDAVIFDAGDEQKCAVTSLAPGGGNNDAAGLQYAANVAARSRRRAKLLVMISDGLPTECSVDALRNLVEQLHRRKGILCAQVAVRPLAEVCFPHYVELTDAELDRSVRRFGEIITALARRALGR